MFYVWSSYTDDNLNSENVKVDLEKKKKKEKKNRM